MAIYNGGLSIKNVSIVEDGDKNGNVVIKISADGNVLTITKGSVQATGDYVKYGGAITTINDFAE